MYKYKKGKDRFDWVEDAAPAEDDDEEPDKYIVKLEQRYSSSTKATIDLLDEHLVPFDLIVRLLETICLENPSYFDFSPAILIFMPGLGEIRRLNDLLAEHPSFGSDHQFRIYPLHSTLSSDDQGAVFEIPPPGIRKIVIGEKSDISTAIHIHVNNISLNSDQYRGNWHYYPGHHLCHRLRKA